MTHARLLFPHPVLRPGGADYADGSSFDAGISAQTRDGRIRLSIDYRLQSGFLDGLVRGGQAACFAMIKFTKTGQRSSLEADGYGATWDLDADDFRGKLVLSTYVVSKAEISPFTSGEHIPEIRDVALSVPAGSILAMGDQHDISLDKTEGDVRAAIQFVPDATMERGEYYINLDGQMIEILMSPQTMTYTLQMRRIYPKMALSMLYVPAVECAILGLENAGEDSLWPGAIRGALERRGISVEDVDGPEANNIAQKIMDLPYKDAADLVGGDD